MISRVIVLLGLVAAPSALAMGYWQGQHSEPEVGVSAAVVRTPVVARPGAGVADAVKYLAGVNVSAAPAAPAAPAPSPAAGPQIDIAVQFRSDVTAVLAGDEPHVVLAGGRTISAGEVYRDGWKVSGLTSQQATLTKGRDTRQVNLFSAPPMQDVQTASAGQVLTGPVILSNGLTPEQRTAAAAAARIPPEFQAMRQQIEAMMQRRGGNSQFFAPGGQGNANGFGGFGGFGGRQNGGRNGGGDVERPQRAPTNQ